MPNNLPPEQLEIQPTMTYVDRPEISETFADSCFRLSIEGLNAKIEFVVNRMDDPKPPAPPTGKAMTACRIVLPLPGMIDLHSKLTQLIGVLQAKGVLKLIAQVPQSGKSN